MTGDGTIGWTAKLRIKTHTMQKTIDSLEVLNVFCQNSSHRLSYRLSKVQRTSDHCSSSATVLCNHALFLQCKVDGFTFYTLSLTMERAHQTYYKHSIQIHNSPPLICKLDVCHLVSSGTRALCQIFHIAAVEEDLLKRGSWQFHPKIKSATSYECPHSAAACLLYPESPPAITKTFSESMAFVNNILAVTYSTPVKVIAMFISCLFHC